MEVSFQEVSSVKDFLMIFFFIIGGFFCGGSCVEASPVQTSSVAAVSFVEASVFLRRGSGFNSGRRDSFVSVGSPCAAAGGIRSIGLR